MSTQPINDPLAGNWTLWKYISCWIPKIRVDKFHQHFPKCFISYPRMATSQDHLAMGIRPRQKPPIGNNTVRGSVERGMDKSH